MSIIDNLTAMLEKGQDNPLLRYSLGNEYFKSGEWDEAVAHLARAVELDAGYSAAWKIYGKALAEAGRHTEVVEILERGIGVAEQKGDV